MTNSLAHKKEGTSSSSISGCLRISRVVAGGLTLDPETKEDNEVLPDNRSCLSNLVTPTTQATTLELDSDCVSDEGICPAASLLYTTRVSASTESDSADWISPEDCGSGKRTLPGLDTVHDKEKRNRAMEVIVDSSNGAIPVRLSTSNSISCASHEENCDAGPELYTSTGNPAFVDTCGCPLSFTRISSDLIDENTEGIAYNNVSVSLCQHESCSDVSSNASKNQSGNIGVVSLADFPIAPMKPDSSAERGGIVRTLQVAPERIQIIPEAGGASSSHASIMHSDDENVKESQKDSSEVVFRDLEAGLPTEITSSVDEEEMHGVDLAEDHKHSSLVEATNQAVSVEAFDHDAASCDVKDLVDSELREPLLAHVKTDDIKSSQDKEVLRGGENKPGGDSLEKEAEVHGLRKRRGTKADAIKQPAGGDSGLGKMPEEPNKMVTTTRTKDPSTDVGQEAKQKPLEKKTGKQGKSAGKPSAVKKSGDPQPLEESQPRAKEEAETNRKMHESLDNFIRQTIRCEPYMNFTSRPGEKPLQRLRPDVFENHVAGKFARGFKVDNGSDPRDMATEESRGMDSNSSDVDGLKDGSTVAATGLAGLGRGAQPSLKVPPGVVAFTQGAAKGTDLQGWLSLSKTKCEKCSREFCSTLNYRRHIRVHRRSLNPEKEDLSKERSKVAAFWDKLTPEEASSIVHYENMNIEELPRQAALDALKAFINQLGLPSLPPGILKAGSSLLDIVQNKSAVHLSSEQLLAILDDASEKTFLCGGTSVPVQRFVFNGEAGKVGLEEKNLVASMGFHIELRLVKAWMADKEAEALRCQQEMIKEEEAAQQKRKKLLEKKRLKKIRQKERKGSTSQLILQELENDPIDEEGNIQGIGEEDDSPTATGSSSSSLASAQDLALAESAELDETDAFGQTDIDEHELVLGEKSDTGKNMSSDEDQVHRYRDGLSQYGRERPQLGSQLGEIGSPYREEEPSARASVSEVGANFQLRPADQVDWDGEFDSRSAYPFSQSRSGRTGEGQSSVPYRKGEQDRTASDFKRREYERTQERRPVRTIRDRLRNDYLEQKPLRDSRGFDARYGDGHPTNFKPLRKPNPYFVKTDSGNADQSNISRLQPYRSKPPGLNRTSIPGNGQVVWTRKVPQPAAVEATKDSQEEIVRDDAESSRGDGWAASEALPDVTLGVLDFAGDVATKLNRVRMENEVDAAPPVPLDVSTGNVITLPTSSSASVSFHIDVNSEDWPPLTQGFWSNSSCNTSLLTKSANFDSSPSTRTGEHIESVSQLSEGDSGIVVGSCSDGSSGLMRTALSSVRLQDSRFAGSSDHVTSAEEMPEVDEGLRDALLVGSNIVPLPKCPPVSISQARLGSNAPYLHHPDDTEVGNLSRAGSLDGSQGLPGVVLSGQEVPLSRIHTAIGSSDGSEPLEKSLGSPLRASGSRSNPITTQPAKSKPHYSSSSPERECSRHNAPPLGHERLAVKQGSWQPSSGRFVSAKVWRAVGMVGERQELSAPLVHVGSGDSASSRLSQDVDSSGRSEGERETSPKAVRQGSLTKDDEFLRGDSQEGRDLTVDRPVVMNFDTSRTGDKQSKLSSSSVPFMPAGFESGLLSGEKAGHTSKAQIDNEVESSISASGLCSWSTYVEVAGTFFNERWRAAVAHASNDEVLNLNTDSISNEAEGLNFLDIVLRQMSEENSRHSPSAESGPSPSSSVVMILEKPAQDAGVHLARIFSDSDHTGVEDIRCPSIIDEQALDGASPHAPSSEDDAGLRDASTSPVGSERDMSGSDMASSAPVARRGNFSESGGGGGVGFSYTRRGNSRQERWHRYSRDRFSEQIYMARRRAPVEKNSRV